jgi:hypothetical protein
VVQKSAIFSGIAGFFPLKRPFPYFFGVAVFTSIFGFPRALSGFFRRGAVFPF